MEAQTHELTTYEAKVQHEANHWLVEAKHIVVDDAETAQAAADWLTEDLAPRRRAVEEFFAPLVSAAHAAHKALTSKRGDILARFAAPEAIVKAKLDAWYQAELERQAEIERQAGAVSLLVATEPEKIHGVAFTSTLRGEVVDLAGLVRLAADQPNLLPLLAVDAKALKNRVKALGHAAAIPGVLLVVEESGVRRVG